MARCEAGACSVECGSPGAGCACISWGDTSEECACFCSPRGFVIVNERKIPFNRFKPGIKITSQTKFNICTHGLPITGLAELLDKFLPNKILVPVNRLNKKVTLSLKNKTFKQIINSSGLVLQPIEGSIPADGTIKKAFNKSQNYSSDK